MTMLINSDLKVAGVKALVVRDLLKKSGGSFRRDWLLANLGVSERKATQVTESLVKEGYIRREQNVKTSSAVPCYSVTDRGREFMLAKASKPIERARAEVLLSDFLNRVWQVNGDSRYRCSVTKALVFGSFLKDAARLADIDLAVDLGYRLEPNQSLSDMCFAHADSSGRHFPNITAQLYWPQTEVFVFLRAKNRYIHIQPWYAFVGMRKEPGFRYKILLGDEAAIRNELEGTLSGTEHPAVNRRVVELSSGPSEYFKCFFSPQRWCLNETILIFTNVYAGPKRDFLDKGGELCPMSATGGPHSGAALDNVIINAHQRPPRIRKYQCLLWVSITNHPVFGRMVYSWGRHQPSGTSQS
jgi:DNA-binding MarR family transcriptional regulator